MIASFSTRPPPTNPIIEFPPSPMKSGFQIVENIQDEMERLKQAQTIFASKYEEKIMGTILKFVDIVGAAIVYINMERILNILNYLKED